MPNSTTSSRTLRCVIGTIVPGLLVALGACGGSDGDRPTVDHSAARAVAPRLETFVGKLDGTDAFVAIETVDGQEVRAYVCDGKSMVQWLDGRVTGDTIAASARDGAAPGSLAASRHGDGFAGTALGHMFSVSRATFPAGLYRGADPSRELRGSWIVLADGSQRGSAVKNQQTTESSVSPNDLEANVGGETTTAVPGGSAGIHDATPLKKQVSLKERCDNLQHSYDAQAFHRSQALQKTPPDVASANQDLEIMQSLLAAMESLGC